MSMTGKRRKSRELAMQMLFQADVGKQNPDEVRKTFWQARDEVEDDTRGFSEDLFRVAMAREEEIDAIIERHSANWKLSRMPALPNRAFMTSWRTAGAVRRSISHAEVSVMAAPKPRTAW